MLEEMREMIAEQLNCEESSITESTSFKDDLGADSLMVMQIIADVEECFGITFDDVDLLSENFSNTGSFCEMIARQVREG